MEYVPGSEEQGTPPESGTRLAPDRQKQPGPAAELRMIEAGKPELLAPAGNAQSLMAAVENGADAVYLGGKSFGARAFAGNFTREELGEALAYAHGRGVRVYVTVNTLVDNREFGELSDFLFFLYTAGADALLVQDLGVIAWVRTVLPGLPLHGSTQMTVHNAAGVQYLAGLGLQRVVLARETTYEELLAIRRQSDLDLEVFVHGALCISYSGQCLFSSMVGGRSGNRGSCAQPCRLAYALVDANERDLSGSCPGRHLLSTRDLMLLGELPALIAAGVAALKIEGRMKRPEYVATVVRIYRDALDRAYDDPERYRVSAAEVRDLAQAFNRGFTSGYFYGNPGAALMSHTRPSHRGLYLGRVLSAEAGRAVIRTNLPLRSGDGIEFWMRKGRREGITIHGLEAGPGSEVELSLPFAVSPGDRVFKTHDQGLQQEAELSFRRPGRRRIPIDVVVTGRLGEPLTVTAVDAEGVRATVRGSVPGARALKHPLTPEVVHAQVERLGNTLFALAGLDCELDGEAMYPLGEINSVRRELTTALEAARIDRYRRRLPEAAAQAAEAFWASLGSTRPLTTTSFDRATFDRAARHSTMTNNHVHPETFQVRDSCFPKLGAGVPNGWRPGSGAGLLAVAVADDRGLQAALDGGAEVVYFGGCSYRGRDAWDLDRALAGIGRCRARHQGGLKAAPWQARPYLIIPRIWKEGERQAVTSWIDAARRLETGVLVGDLGGLALALQAGLEIVTEFSIHVYNDPAAMALLQQGAFRLTLSPELNREQLRGLVFRGASTELIVHGTLPLMISEHCPLGAVTADRNRCPRLCRKGAFFLRDRRGYRFPMQFDDHCRMTLYNARELCLIEHLDGIIQDGYGAIRLELRSCEPGRVLEITRIYRDARDRIRSGDWSRDAGRQAWERLSRISPQGLTRGHYLRGVLNPP